MIEVWEKLDCESIGAAEIEAVEEAVAGRFGAAAVESPMAIGRILADEGAELRHSEIMELHLRRADERPYDAALRNILKLDSLDAAVSSIRSLENLRRKFASDGDKNGLRHVRQIAIDAKGDLEKEASAPRTSEDRRLIVTEISQWLSHWLQTPQIFDDWVAMRQRSPEFAARFGQRGEPAE